jgi:hypothetical protein
LAQGDRLIDAPTMGAPFAVALDPARGGPSRPVGQVLRLSDLRHCYQLSDRVLV